MIAIYTLDTCLSILFEEEQVLQIWLDSLLSQQKGRSEDGKIPKPNYEHMWEVNVKQFKPEDYLNTYSMSGTYRLCATPEELRFFATGSDTPITFKIINLRSFSCTDRRFQLETGRRTPSGSGWLYIRCEDKEIAANLYRVVRFWLHFYLRIFIT